MSGTYFFYIAKQYSKNLVLMLMGITLSIAVIDYLQNAVNSIESSNKAILYLFYIWEFRLSQFYPLAIVFAAVVTYMKLVSSNTLVSLLSFGYTKKQLYIPFVLPAVSVYFVLMFLQTGEFSYAKERAWSILHQTQSARAVNDLFFKYNTTFVYVKKLDPIKKILKDVTVFEFKNKKVQQAIVLDRAIFDGRYWVAANAVQTDKLYTDKGVLRGFKREDKISYRFLKDYKPKVIELIYEGDSLSLLDAVQTYLVLKKQNLDSYKVRAAFYSKSILPLFAFAIITILFFKTRYYSRYMNRELVWAVSLGGTLVVWGILYALYSLSAGGVILPEIAIVMPVFLLLFYASYLYLYSNEKLA